MFIPSIYQPGFMNPGLVLLRIDHGFVWGVQEGKL